MQKQPELKLLLLSNKKLSSVTDDTVSSWIEFADTDLSGAPWSADYDHGVRCGKSK